MSDGLNQGSYTRTEGAPRNGRDPTIPRFHFEPVQDHVASAQAGRPIFTNEERVQIIMPGNPNSPVERVNDSHRQRWPEHYDAFRKGHEHVVHGTPLEQWPILSRSMVLELKAMEIHTVEQCAGLGDLAIQRIGMGGRRIKELAEAYLDDAAATRITSEAIDRAERAEALITDLQRRDTEMRTLMDQMNAELQRFRMTPPAPMTYIPGDHDPMQAHNMSRPVEIAPSAGPSSLDSLPTAPRRGRPPKTAQMEAAD